MVPVRHFSSKDKNKRKPITPVTSKIKKIKMKSYSWVSAYIFSFYSSLKLLLLYQIYMALRFLIRSFKMRFRVMNDGNIRRWREGKRHNAHLKVFTFSCLSILLVTQWRKLLKRIIAFQLHWYKLLKFLVWHFVWIGVEMKQFAFKNLNFIGNHWNW